MTQNRPGRPQRLGRPRLDPTADRPGEPINITFPPRDYAAAVKLAAARRESIQDVIRRAVHRELNKPAS